MEPILALLCHKATKERMDGLNQLNSYLEDGRVNEEEHLDELAKSLETLLNSSNMLIVQASVQAVALMLKVYKMAMEKHLQLVKPLIDRLGDGKAQVRDASLATLLSFAKTLGPAPIVELIYNAMTDHKAWRVREQVLLFVQCAMTEHGAAKMGISRAVPALAALLSDSNGSVREAAADAAVVIYKHVGSRLTDDLRRRNVPASKLNTLEERFLAEGVLDSSNVSASEGKGTSVVGQSKGGTHSVSRSASISSSSGVSASGKKCGGGSNIGNAHSVRQDVIEGFDEAANSTAIRVSQREAPEAISAVAKTIGNVDVDWEIRIAALQRLNGLIVGGIHLHPDFSTIVKTLERPLVLSIRDLRSTVARETCATVVILSRTMRDKFAQLATVLVPVLFKLVVVSIKVMSESAHMAICEVISNTVAPRLLPSLQEGLSSRSAPLRVRCIEYLGLVLSQWPTSVLERQVSVLEDCLMLGLRDATADARIHARRAFWGFAGHFSSRSQALCRTLDGHAVKLLHEEQRRMENEIDSSQKTSTRTGRASSASSKSRPPISSSGGNNNNNNTEDVKDMSAGPKRVMSVPSTGRVTTKRFVDSSAVDDDVEEVVLPTEVHPVANISSNPTALRRSSIRPPSNRSSVRGGAPSSMPRPQSLSSEEKEKKPAMMMTYPPTRAGSGSRANPSSRISPTVVSSSNSNNSVSGAKRVPNVAGPRPSSAASIGGAAGRIRMPVTTDIDVTVTPTALSVAVKAATCPIEDLSVIMKTAESTSWSERVEAFNALLTLVQSSQPRKSTELARIVDLLCNGLGDTHMRVVGLALDVLHDIIAIHSNELSNYVDVLFARLFQHVVTESNTTNIINKVTRVLDILRDLFPAERLLNVSMKILCDTVTPLSLKAKATTLDYLLALLPIMTFEDIDNSVDFRVGLAKIISLTGDPRHVDVRRSAEDLLIGLHKLSPSLFESVVAGYPQRLQNTTHRIVVGFGNSEPKEVTFDADMSIEQVVLTEDSSTAEIVNEIEENEVGGNGSAGYDPKQYQDDGTLLSKMGRVALSNVSQHRHFPKPEKFDPVVSSTSVDLVTLRSSSSTSSVDSQSTPAVRDKAVHAIIRKLSLSGENIQVEPEEKKRALYKLAKLSRENDSSIWASFYSHILVVLLDATDDMDETVRELALKVLREIISNQPSYLSDYVSVTLHKLLDRHNDTVRDVVLSAEDTLRVLPTVVPASELVVVLSPMLSDREGPELLAAIKLLGSMMSTADADSVSCMLPVLLPGLFEGFKNSLAEVRKAVVFCLVEMYMLLGETLRPHFDELNASQTKLLNIYINKAMERHAHSSIRSDGTVVTGSGGDITRSLRGVS